MFQKDLDDIMSLSDDNEASKDPPKTPEQDRGTALRRTRSQTIQEALSQEARQSKRRKLVDEHREAEKGEDEEEEEEEAEIEEEEVEEVEGETPEQKQKRIEREREESLGLKLEVPIWIEFLKEPYKKDKKGNLQPVKGNAKADYDAPYPALRLRVYQSGNKVQWLKEDVSRHMGRRQDEIDWSLVKWCDYSGSRSTYRLAGASSKDWGNTLKDWSKNVKKPKAIALLMKRIAPPVTEQPEPPVVTEDAAPVAGKANPLRNLTPGTLHWRKQLEDAHPIGACATHPKFRCAQRDGLHFILEIPQFTAWACYLNKNPAASLYVPPPVPLFNGVNAARGGSTLASTQPSAPSTSGTIATTPGQTTAEALQMATLAVLLRLAGGSTETRANPPIPALDPAPQQGQYGSATNRYSSAPSLANFCDTYDLKDMEAKLESLGFRPGDTPEGLAAVTGEDLKTAKIRSLEWSRLKSAVDDYWTQLWAKRDDADK